MTRDTYKMIEAYMLLAMEDSAHDAEHIYRVLYNALEIAGTEKNVDWDVLIAACLLHDIGRREQFADPAVCHAAVGSEKAYRFLREQDFSEEFARQVRNCIRTHRFRSDAPPETLEAKILFDADKLDVTGAIGIARTLLYQGKMGEPLYTALPGGGIDDGTHEAAPTFFREYKYKLEGLYGSFYTERGAQMARERQRSAVDFYECLYGEVDRGSRSGQKALDTLLD